MSDFGSDVGNTVVSQTVKIIADLLEKIYRTWENRHQRRLDKYRINDIKDEKSRRKAIESLEGVYGAVALKKLKKTGEELSYPAVLMSEKQMSRLVEECKRSGVLISSLKPVYDEKDKLWKCPLVCRKRDLPELKFIVESLAVELAIAKIDEKIEMLEAKGEAMTKEDKAAVEKLKEEKAVLLQGDANEMNDKTAEDTVNKAVNNEEYKLMTFDKALNRHTGKLFDGETEYIIADGADPTKYIKCRGYNDEYNGKKYGKTEFEVFKDGKCVYKTHDGRFDNRPLTYWDDEKAKMKELGGFGDRLFKFTSIETYKKWADKCIEENQQELGNMEKEGDKDYSLLIKDAQMQLKERGAEMRGDTVYSMKTTLRDADGNIVGATELVVKDDMSLEEKTNVAEAIIIGKQIQNYETIIGLKDELMIANLKVKTLDEGTEEYKEAQVELSRVQEKYKVALETEQSLIDERKGINAVQNEQEVRNEIENELINDELSKDGQEKSEHNHDERLDEEKPKFKSQKQWDEEIKKQKEAKAGQVEVKNDQTQVQTKSSPGRER